MQIVGDQSPLDAATPAHSAFEVAINEKSHRDGAGERIAVLANLRFRLATNAFTCIIGPSGCGKTTTLRILAGLDRDYAGHVDPRIEAARIAVAFQEPRLLPWRTVAENVSLALDDAAPREREQRVEAALADVGLAGLGGRYPAELSLGQARRAALARAFAVRPDVLFLDEPFVSLDETSAQRLRALLLTLWERHKVTVLMVTHNVREAIQLADTVLLLSERPAHVVDAVAVDIARSERTEEAVAGFAHRLAARYPTIIAL